MTRKKQTQKKRVKMKRAPLAVQRAANWSVILGKLKRLNNDQLKPEDVRKIMNPILYASLMMKQGSASFENLSMLYQAHLFNQALLDRMIEFSNLKKELTYYKEKTQGVGHTLEVIFDYALAHEGIFICTDEDLEHIKAMTSVLEGLAEASTLNHLAVALQRSHDQLNENRRFKKEVIVNSSEFSQPQESESCDEMAVA